jgi:hypothetical protein
MRFIFHMRVTARSGKGNASGGQLSSGVDPRPCLAHLKPNQRSGHDFSNCFPAIAGQGEFLPTFQNDFREKEILRSSSPPAPVKYPVTLFILR